MAKTEIFVIFKHILLCFEVSISFFLFIFASNIYAKYIVCRFFVRSWVLRNGVGNYVFCGV